MMKAILIIAAAVFCISVTKAQKPGADKRFFYEIKVYHFKDPEQVSKTEAFLKAAFLPALHRAGIAKAGVFKSIDIDTAADKKLYVFIPSASLQKLTGIDDVLFKDEQFKKDGGTYLNTAFDQTAYQRIETMILRAFADMPAFTAPSLSTPLSERVYELRSYEGPTETLYRQKVYMFNEGKEISIFSRLNFNAVFYAEVIAGSHMPNLMYLTTFNNKADRDAHWDKFTADPEWKRLSGLPEYQHTVSKADILFLRPADYSDF